MPDFVPALDDLSWNGDLRWRMPLAVLRLESNLEIEIALEHEMAALDYAAVESRIAVRPLETWLSPCGQGRICWQRPGGGRRVFSHRDRMKVPPSPSIAIDAPVKYYEQAGVRLFWNAAKAWIEDAGWVLHYERGGLVRFSSPSGRVYYVSRQGRRIITIHSGDKALLILNVTKHGTLECTTSHGVVQLAVEHTPDHRIEMIKGKGGRPIVSFRYQSDGLLAEVRRPLMQPLEFSWKQNQEAARGDSPYHLPIHLAKAGECSYRYRTSSGVISLEQFSANTPARQIRIGVQYGRILWVRSSP